MDDPQDHPEYHCTGMYPEGICRAGIRSPHQREAYPPDACGKAAASPLPPLYAMEERAYGRAAAETAAFSKAMYAFARALKEEEEAFPLEQKSPL